MIPLTIRSHYSLMWGTDSPATICQLACEGLLAETGFRASDVDFFACSQPTAWYGKACCEALGIDVGRTLSTFTAFGHPMPASVSINLWTAATSGEMRLRCI